MPCLLRITLDHTQPVASLVGTPWGCRPEYLVRRWCLLEVLLAMKAREQGADIIIVPVFFTVGKERLDQPLPEVLAQWEQLERDSDGRPDDEHISASEVQQKLKALADEYQSERMWQPKGGMQAFAESVAVKVARQVDHVLKHWEHGEG
jgi:hypothetical protein